MAARLLRGKASKMRIVSKFTDYYDSVQRHGQDQRTLYLRRYEPIGDPSLDSLLREDKVLTDMGGGFFDSPRSISWAYERHGFKNKESTCYPVGIGHIFVAGKTYRYFEWDVYPLHLGQEGKVYHYSLKGIENFLHQYGKLVKDIYGAKGEHRDTQVINLGKYLAQQGTSETKRLLVDNKIVIAGLPGIRFLHQYPGEPVLWHKDVCLKEFQFFKQMDANLMFQELDMYISGVLPQASAETINISDKDRVYQHGFDEYSFRKPPGKKRRNRTK